MIRHIIRTDLRNLAADRSLPAVATIFVLLLCYGAWNGAGWVKSQRATLDAAIGEQNTRLAGLASRIAAAEGANLSPFQDPRMPNVTGSREGVPYLTLPPASLAVLAIGQSDLYPYYVKASTQSTEAVMSADEIENPSNLLSGRFDLAFVLVYLYPLLILAMSYNLLSAEKEQGTLVLTLSQPVSLGTLLRGKIAARASVLGGLAIALSAVATAAGGTSIFSSAMLQWTAVLAIYGGFWLALAVVVNALGRSSAANALILCACWTVLALIVPSAVNLAAASTYPVPSRVEMIQAIRQASREAAKQGGLLLAKYLEDHPELAPEGNGLAPDAASTALAVQQETERMIAPVLRRFDEQLSGQQRIAERFRYLSPAVLAQAAMNDLAGSSVERFENFRQQVDQFLAGWRAYFSRKILAREMMRPEDVAKLPRFTYVDEDPAAVRTRVLWSLAGMLLPTVLLAMAGGRLLRAYRVAG